MKAKDIQVGKTYVNRGAGKTRRTVLAIGDDHRPERWYSTSPAPDEPGVLYRQENSTHKLYLSSFAQWCGKEIEAASGIKGKG